MSSDRGKLPDVCSGQSGMQIPREPAVRVEASHFIPQVWNLFFPEIQKQNTGFVNLGKCSSLSLALKPRDRDKAAVTDHRETGMCMGGKD